MRAVENTIGHSRRISNIALLVTHDYPETPFSPWLSKHEFPFVSRKESLCCSLHAGCRTSGLGLFANANRIITAFSTGPHLGPFPEYLLQHQRISLSSKTDGWVRFMFLPAASNLAVFPSRRFRETGTRDSLHCSSFLGLPYRILSMNLVKPKKRTTMETIGKAQKLQGTKAAATAHVQVAGCGG